MGHVVEIRVNEDSGGVKSPPCIEIGMNEGAGWVKPRTGIEIGVNGVGSSLLVASHWSE